MARWHFRALVVSLGLVLAAVPVVEGANRSRGRRGERPQIRLGIADSLFRETPESLMLILMKPFKTLMEEQTGVDSTLSSGGDYQSLARAIAEDRVQVGVFHGFEFAWAKEKFPELEAVLIAVNGEPYARAHLVVRKDFHGAGVGDLKGQRLALPRLNTEHAQLYLERRCAGAGAAPRDFYAAITQAADTEDALDMVVEGKATATVVDHEMLASYQRSKQGRAASLKNLQSSEPFPCAVLAYKSGAMPKSLVSRFRTGMKVAHKTRRGREMLQMYRISRFEDVPDDFEESLTTIARAYPAPAAQVTKAR